MKIFIKAKPNAREAKIEKIDETHFVVAVREPPLQGKANAAITRSLAEYFNVPHAHIRIIAGYASREKIIEIV